MFKVFISYSHKQSNYVYDILLPLLEAGGSDVLTDRGEFEVGKALIGQMDATQDEADRCVLLLSPEYLASDYCMHELRRAVDNDPDFSSGSVIPVVVEPCELPELITRANPLRAEVFGEQTSDALDNVLAACGIDLGAPAARWLSARDDLNRLLSHDSSVNLVVTGRAEWRGLIQHVIADLHPSFALIDMESGKVRERHGLFSQILADGRNSFPQAPSDLAEFERLIEARPDKTRVALTHFDRMNYLDYGLDFFTTLRYLVSEVRKLVLLVESRQPFASYLPAEYFNVVSSLDLKTVELRGA